MQKDKARADKARADNEMRLGGMMLLPPKKGVCQECATDHEPQLPHNQQSIYYQYAFYAKHGRWPTWADAMEHCTEEMKSFWKAELAKRGQKV